MINGGQLRLELGEKNVPYLAASASSSSGRLSVLTQDF